MKLDGKTLEELVAMRKAICDDPSNKLVGQLYLYTKPARNKMDKIDGETVNDCGYSGR